MRTIRDSYYRNVGLTSPEPLAFEVEKAEGIYLYDSSGKRFTDLISGISVSSLGHGNKSIIQAVQEQAGKYMHTMVYGEHIQAPQVEYARLLCDHLPESLDNVFFVNSGTEAVEGAMKLAKKITGRYELISCRNAYHGSTHGSQSLMNSEYFSGPYRPFLPGIKHIDYDDIESLEVITEKSAAVFVETIQGEAGVQIASHEFMQALQSKCKETGCLLVFDEIQTGFGRTGKLFAFEHYNIIPDILLIAKAMGAGMPIGAFVANKKMMSSLADQPVLGHINTFGGHPVSSAAAVAGLQFLLEDQLIDTVEEKGLLFKELIDSHHIKELRQIGLMLAVDLEDPDKVQKFIALAFKEGILIDWFLYNDGALRIAPPLIITKDEIREISRKFNHILLMI